MKRRKRFNPGEMPVVRGLSSVACGVLFAATATGGSLALVQQEAVAEEKGANEPAVLYLSAPHVSTPQAREAAAVARGYRESKDPATEVALFYATGAGEPPDAETRGMLAEAEGEEHIQQALASITGSKGGGATAVNTEAAEQAGQVLLAQSGIESPDSEGEELASGGSSEDGTRPELGDGSTAPEGGESSNEDSAEKPVEEPIPSGESGQPPSPGGDRPGTQTEGDIYTAIAGPIPQGYEDDGAQPDAGAPEGELALDQPRTASGPEDSGDSFSTLPPAEGSSDGEQEAPEQQEEQEEQPEDTTQEPDGTLAYLGGDPVATEEQPTDKQDGGDLQKTQPSEPDEGGSSKESGEEFAFIDPVSSADPPDEKTHDSGSGKEGEDGGESAGDGSTPGPAPIIVLGSREDDKAGDSQNPAETPEYEIGEQSDEGGKDEQAPSADEPVPDEGTGTELAEMPDPENDAYQSGDLTSPDGTPDESPTINQPDKPDKGEEAYYPQPQEPESKKPESEDPGTEDGPDEIRLVPGQIGSTDDGEPQPEYVPPSTGTGDEQPGEDHGSLIGPSSYEDPQAQEPEPATESPNELPPQAPPSDAENPPPSTGTSSQTPSDEPSSDEEFEQPTEAPSGGDPTQGAPQAGEDSSENGSQSPEVTGPLAEGQGEGSQSIQIVLTTGNESEQSVSGGEHPEPQAEEPQAEEPQEQVPDSGSSGGGKPETVLSPESDVPDHTAPQETPPSESGASRSNGESTPTPQEGGSGEPEGATSTPEPAPTVAPTQTQDAPTTGDGGKEPLPVQDRPPRDNGPQPVPSPDKASPAGGPSDPEPARHNVPTGAPDTPAGTRESGIEDGRTPPQREDTPDARTIAPAPSRPQDAPDQFTTQRPRTGWSGSPQDQTASSPSPAPDNPRPQTVKTGNSSLTSPAPAPAPAPGADPPNGRPQGEQLGRGAQPPSTPIQHAWTSHDSIGDISTQVEDEVSTGIQDFTINTTGQAQHAPLGVDAGRIVQNVSRQSNPVSVDAAPDFNVQQSSLSTGQPAQISEPAAADLESAWTDEAASRQISTQPPVQNARTRDGAGGAVESGLQSWNSPQLNGTQIQAQRSADIQIDPAQAAATDSSSTAPQIEPVQPLPEVQIQGTQSTNDMRENLQPAVTQQSEVEESFPQQDAPGLSTINPRPTVPANIAATPPEPQENSFRPTQVTAQPSPSQPVPQTAPEPRDPVTQPLQQSAPEPAQQQPIQSPEPAPAPAQVPKQTLSQPEHVPAQQLSPAPQVPTQNTDSVSDAGSTSQQTLTSVEGTGQDAVPDAVPDVMPEAGPDPE